MHINRYIQTQMCRKPLCYRLDLRHLVLVAILQIDACANRATYTVVHASTWHFRMHWYY